jgi:glycine/sarcosine N-methyltransferase
LGGDEVDDLYAGFADRYDLFSGGFGRHSPAKSEFFRRLFERHGVLRVLDCACGTGNDLQLFHSLGCEVHGSDISPAMLARARRNLAGSSLAVPLRQADYRELPRYYDRPFDAVLCLSSSIDHMPDGAEAVRAFTSMRGVLREGGILVLTQGTTDKQWAEKPRFILAADEPEYSRLFVLDYLDGGGARYNILDILRDGEKPRLEIWSAAYARFYLRDDQEELLRETGFRDISFYGSYSFEPYDKAASNYLITVAGR